MSDDKTITVDSGSESPTDAYCDECPTWRGSPLEARQHTEATGHTTHFLARLPHGVRVLYGSSE